MKILVIGGTGLIGSKVVERLRAKARLLGTGIVAIHPFHAGFARLAPHGG